MERSIKLISLNGHWSRKEERKQKVPITRKREGILQAIREWRTIITGNFRTESKWIKQNPSKFFRKLHCQRNHNLFWSIDVWLLKWTPISQAHTNKKQAVKVVKSPRKSYSSIPTLNIHMKDNGKNSPECRVQTHRWQ